MIRLFLACSIFLLVTSCGGGGGSSTSTSALVSLNLGVNQTGYKPCVSNWAVGDLNNDGLDDVVIGGWSCTSGATSNLTILIQNSDGTLTDKTSTLLANKVYQGSQHIFIADFDKDGNADIWIPGFDDCSGCSAKSVMLWGTGSSFTRDDFTTSIDSHGACIFDLNGDGYLDMVVRGVYSGGINTSGYYINNGNRTFTFNTSAVVTGGSTCALIKNTATGNIALVQGNTNQLAGYQSSIDIIDSSLNLVSRVGVMSHDAQATDLINSLVMDVNGDGYEDFILIFNRLTSATPGTKEVWLNSGTGSFSYSYTIDSDSNNQYSAFSTVLGGQKYVMFDAPNGDARLYKVAAGAWSAYAASSFSSMATQAGGHYGVADWTIGMATVYLNRTLQKMYMLQYVNGKYYTSVI